MNNEKFKKIIQDTIYTGVAYPHLGNNNILAANWILYEMGITDIDIIYKLAKIIEENSTYAHEISNNDLNKIMELLSELLKEFIKIEQYK